MKNTKKKTTEVKTENKPTLVAFLLDRSGSMEECKDETIKGFNAYIKELCAKDKGCAMRFTLTQFDTQGVDIVHDAVPLKDVKLLTAETYSPRAGTPLYDAMGRTIRATETKATGKFKVLFVTLTDGLENSSREWKSDSIKVLIKSKEGQAHWTFAYIGVGLQGWAATSAIAFGTMGVSNVLRSSHQNTGEAYARFAGVTHAYACSTQNVSASVQNLWGPNATTEEEPTPIAQTKK
jgi:uncharacterized protein YegL